MCKFMCLSGFLCVPRGCTFLLLSKEDIASLGVDLYIVMSLKMRNQMGSH